VRRVTARELVPLLAGWRSARGAGYGTLADRLRQLVLDGRLPVHVVLPSERDLATALGTSRTTTAAAYRQMRDAGIADGSGSPSVARRHRWRR
jgi:DNA-binding FadR family transcriptional regulator